MTSEVKLETFHARREREVPHRRRGQSVQARTFSVRACSVKRRVATSRHDKERHVATPLRPRCGVTKVTRPHAFEITRPKRRVTECTRRVPLAAASCVKPDVAAGLRVAAPGTALDTKLPSSATRCSVLQNTMVTGPWFHVQT